MELKHLGIFYGFERKEIAYEEVKRRNTRRQISNARFGHSKSAVVARQAYQSSARKDFECRETGALFQCFADKHRMPKVKDLKF